MKNRFLSFGLIFTLFIILQLACKNTVNDKQNTNIANANDKTETAQSITEEKVLAIIAQYNEKSYEELIEKEKSVEIKLNELIKNNPDVTTPLVAALAQIEKINDHIFTSNGEISWGNGVNLTFLVFDLSKDKIYIWNRMEDEVNIIGEDEDYPEVFKEWIKNDY